MRKNLAIALALFVTTTAASKRPAPPLSFEARAVKSVFVLGEDVVLSFRLKNLSRRRVFVARNPGAEEFVGLTVIGPDGKEVPWEGKIHSVSYTPEAFTVLRSGESISGSAVISLKGGRGFQFTRPGNYTVRAEYSLGPPAYFKPLAKEDWIPDGVFRSPDVTFRVVSRSAAGDRVPHVRN